MNAKEELMYRIIDNCIRYCTIGDDPNSKVYITREKVLGKARHLNVVMTRAICVNQLIKAGFNKPSIAQVLNKTVTSIRHLIKASDAFEKFSTAYRNTLREWTKSNLNLYTSK